MTDEELNDLLKILKKEIDGFFAICVKNKYTADEFRKGSDKILKKFFDQFSTKEDIIHVHKKMSLDIHPDRFIQHYPERLKYLEKIDSKNCLFQSAQELKDRKLKALDSKIYDNQDDINISESHPTFEFYKNLSDNIAAFFTENIFSFSPYIYKPILIILAIENLCSFMLSIYFLIYLEFICLPFNQLITLQTLAINKLTNDTFNKKLEQEFNEAKFSKFFLELACLLNNKKINLEETDDEVLVAYLKLIIETALANNPESLPHTFEFYYNIYKRYNDCGYSHLKLYIKTIYEYLNNKDKSYLNAFALIDLFPISVLLEAIRLILITIAFLTAVIVSSPVLVTSFIFLGPLYLINQINNKFIKTPEGNKSKGCDDQSNQYNQNGATRPV